MKFTTEPYTTLSTVPRKSEPFGSKLCDDDDCVTNQHLLHFLKIRPKRCENMSLPVQELELLDATLQSFFIQQQPSTLCLTPKRPYSFTITMHLKSRDKEFKSVNPFTFISWVPRKSEPFGSKLCDDEERVGWSHCFCPQGSGRSRP